MHFLPKELTFNQVHFVTGVDMLARALWLATLVVGMTACASAPSTPAPPLQLAWQDQAFADAGAVVSVTREDLFRLDPDLAGKLADPSVQRLGAAKRLQRLIAMLYGQQVKRFDYAAGHSTVAAETWQLRRGDCLSLTVLAYAMGRALKLDAQMQEVPVAAVFDRRDQLDFLSQHVNVLFRHTSPIEAAYRASSVRSDHIVLDFEPELGARFLGEALSDQAILARYYNNVAAEHLGKGRQALAYVHFKAAILADPSYAAGYSNLALLYRGKGLLAEAEQLLRHAVALNSQTYVPLHALHQLLREQGRVAEAGEIDHLLQAKRDVDPYHWIELGLQRLQADDYRAAIRALERAQGLTTGFEEVHRYLALAYWRAGEQAHAQQQLAVLNALTGDGPELSRLRKKISANP